ncbi:hypothetical protein I5Q34_32515 [Streptomyces sp. AV19]|uniref:NucA/NucB deoxyribonuclease domain-containing protein n=1 Tax=Streptomyces sp. AV19 TaxID=2793068 RepID=UPI0018FEDD31|nr:hypothetical protein [Streptomyces sp. AV19]MBH1938930.1 hypothetical protein [Streptomyces sp. AV19]MDG4531623.1 hypothetical protein [Streptomyces sp. AV19]
MTVLAAAALLVPAASPAGADDDPAEGLSVESHVLTFGAERPSWKDTGTASGQALLRAGALDQTAEESAIAQTTGPAAALARRLAQATAAANAPGGAGQVSPAPPATPPVAPRAAGVSYPEPPHDMRLKECKDGLGTKNKLYVKSRFAVCTGASFIQYWRKKGKPVGESAFNMRVVGTIAKGSRDIKLKYFFTEFDKAGKTSTGGLLISARTAIKQTWPASAKTKQSGTLPGGRSFDSLKNQSFTQTFTVAKGQGSKPDDLVFAAWQPTVKIMPPPGYDFKGDQGGTTFIFAPRWDAAQYVTKGGGAAVFNNVVPMYYSTKAGAPERAAAQHVKDALTNPAKTKPDNARKKVPGGSVQDPLHRLFHNKKQRDANRSRAIATCVKYWGKDYTKDPRNPTVKRECDEYPFASTYEGAAKKVGGKYADNFSARPIRDSENRAGGLLLSGFMTKNRIIDSQGAKDYDAYYVVVR